MRPKNTILRAIIRNNKTASTPKEIANLLKRPTEDVNAEIVTLEAAGLVITCRNWEGGHGTVVTLTSLAASRLKVQIRDWGGVNAHWAPLDDKPLKSKGKTRPRANEADNANAIYSIADTRLGPEDLAMEAEQAGAVSVLKDGTVASKWASFTRFDESSLPYPTSLIGAGAAPWDNKVNPICPACSNLPLKANEFCLRCDAWGLDHLLASVNVEPITVSTFPERPVNIFRGLPV